MMRSTPVSPGHLPNRRTRTSQKRDLVIAKWVTAKNTKGQPFMNRSGSTADHETDRLVEEASSLFTLVASPDAAGRRVYEDRPPERRPHLSKQTRLPARQRQVNLRQVPFAVQAPLSAKGIASVPVFSLPLIRLGNALGLAIALALCVPCMVWAAEPATVFPGAVGFGVDSPAGRGGQIIRVENLNAEGPGSLRAALAEKGPRIIVFEVGGVIDLDGKPLRIGGPFVTVAGQTAPEPGITIIRGGIGIGTHDVLVRHIRVRPGDAGREKRSGWEPDGISTSGGNAYNIIIDHCSVTWAVDENLSASGPRNKGPEATSHRITFSNCIIAEGLDNATHAKGRHSKGSLIHDCCTDIAIIGNLYAHNVQRNPYFKAHTTGVIVNNVIYNPGVAAVQLGYVPKEWRDAAFEPINARVSIVGNVMIHGTDTKHKLPLASWLGDVFEEDNIAVDRNAKPVDICSSGIVILDTKPAWPEGLTPLPSKEVVDHMVRHVGARPKTRDAIDERIIRDFTQRTGRIIDSQEEVGGYPHPAPTTRKLDIPENDIDAWLAKMAAEME